MSATGRLPVRYLFSRDCPSHEDGRRLLDDAAGAAGVEIEVEALEVSTDADAAALGFAGSPTYLAGGRDLFPLAEPDHAPRADACRIFARSDGRLGPLPELADLTDRLRAAAAATPA